MIEGVDGRSAGTRQTRRIRPLLPESWRSFSRPRILTELIFVATSYGLYTLVRNQVPGHRIAATHRAHDILHLEHDLGLNFELTLNKALEKVGWLAQVADYWYAVMHFAVTLGVLIWVFRRHPLQYRGARTVLYTTNLVALIGFWLYALRPPRLFDPPFIDTVVTHHTWGSWGSAGVASATNQYAAMPSLHIGWSLWCAITIVRLSPHLWARILGAVYPMITFLVIIATANHYVLDAVGGALTLAVAFGIEWLLFGRSAYAAPPPGAEPAVPPPRTSHAPANF